MGEAIGRNTFEDAEKRQASPDFRFSYLNILLTFDQVVFLVLTDPLARGW